MIKNRINTLFARGNTAALNGTTTENQFAEWIDQASANQSRHLADLLYERHPVYEGRSTNVMLRMRGYGMARFEQIGLPSTALPYVIEALESSFDPYMVAAAAKALRGMKQPHPQTTGYLIKAIYNIWQHDQPISFSQYHVQWPLKTYSTALIEIFTTFKWMGSYAQEFLVDLELILIDFGHHLNSNSRLHLTEAIEAVKNDDRVVKAGCCDVHLNIQSDRSSKKQYIDAKSFPDLILEDQQGEQFHWEDFFEGKPTLLAFFYTRCMNPRKCTLTIQKLASIQSMLNEQKLSDKIKVAAITYDPAHDTAGALKIYGLGRKFLFDENNKMFRVSYEFNSVVSAFDLGVNFNESLVNQHRIELFLLDKDGHPIKKFVRLQWDPQVVVQELERHLGQSNYKWRTTIKRIGTTWGSTLLTLLIAFFPKCAFCWAAYLSLLGIASIGSIPYSPLLFPLLCVFLAVHLWFLSRRAAHKRQWTPFLLTLLGILLLILCGPILQVNEIKYLGMFFMICGSLLSSMSNHTYQILTSYIGKLTRIGSLTTSKNHLSNK